VHPTRATAILLVALVASCGVVRGADTEETGTPPHEERPRESGVTESLVVSASATTEDPLRAPAAVDLLEAEDLALRPGDTLVDQLRRVPGVNVVQFSARDMNIASRSATGGVNNQTLVLADGRSLYQDFLGFVMWEFAPTDMSLVERVEVVRGPASALWGANAMGGVVHVLTKSPRDTLGSRGRVETGNHGVVRAEARESFLAGPWAVRVSGGYQRGDPFPRPATITNFLGEAIDPDLGLLADDHRNSGTAQPRVDARADWRGASADWILQAGHGRTRGWIATGLGPFDIHPTTGQSYVQARYRSGPHEAELSANLLDGSARNLVNALPMDFVSGATAAALRSRLPLGGRGVLGWGVELSRSEYELSIAPAGDRRTRTSAFGEMDLRLAPKWSALAGLRADHFRETIGTVWSPRGAVRFEPRPSHVLRLAAGRAFRSPSVIETDLLVPSIPVAILDWNAIDQQLFEDGTLDPALFPDGFFALMAKGVCETQPDNCGARLGAIPEYVAVTAASGLRGLQEEVLDSVEVGYTARLGRVGLAASLYRTRSRGGIAFRQQASYGVGADGAPGTADDIVLPSDPDQDGIDEAPPVDVCPFGLDGFTEPVDFSTLCAAGPVPYNLALSLFLDGQVPALFRYGNGARERNRGMELGLTFDARRDVSLWLNYSFQADPVSDGVNMYDRIAGVRAERDAGADLDGDGAVGDTNSFVNIPARHRISAGAQVDRGRWFASLGLDQVDTTFWQDVQTEDFWGFVPSYLLVGARGGWRWPARGLELSAQVTNLTDERIQQHILGDIIGRRASVSLVWSGERGRERAGSGDRGDSR